MPPPARPLIYDAFSGQYKPPAPTEPQKVGAGMPQALVDNARRGPQPTICEHNLPKSKCKKCKAMARICKHGKKKELCRECDGSALCIHDLRKKVPPHSPSGVNVAAVHARPVLRDASSFLLPRCSLLTPLVLIFAGVSPVRWLCPLRPQQNPARVQGVWWQQLL